MPKYDHGIRTICGACGHDGDIDTFIVDNFGRPLPHNQVQCPACGIVVERVINDDVIQPVRVNVIGHHFMRIG